MKKNFLFAILAAGLAVVACSPKAEKAAEVEDGEEAVETVEEVVKTAKDYTPSKKQIDSVSYLVGINFGSFIKGYDFGDLNYAQIKKGMNDFIKAKGLRIELDTFRKTLLADEGKTTGRYDTRFTTFGYPDVQGDNEFFAGEDPSYDAINAAYLDVYMKMLGDIGFKGYANYEGLSMKVNESWNWNHQAPGTMGSPQTPNVAFDIATALRRNPTSRILFFGGIHDAATPYWNVRHDMGKLLLPQALKGRIEYHGHSNGHMLYCDQVALEAAGPELKAFYEKRHEQ